MHWRHLTRNHVSEKMYSIGTRPFFQDQYYKDYYMSDAPISLHVFGICSHHPDEHVVNLIDGRYRLYYIISGKGWINQNQFKEGDIVFISNALACNISSDQNDPCTYTWIAFSGGKSEKYLLRAGLTQSLMIYKNRNQTEINRIFYEMMEVEHPEKERALFLEGCFLTLLSLSVYHQDPNAAPTQNTQKKIDKRVNNAVRYICKHFQDHDLRLEDIEEATETSSKYLQRIFKERVGISIYQYIIKLRLDTAVDLLINSNYTISEISYMVGYHDRCTFSELFKKHYGCYPTQYVSNQTSIDTSIENKKNDV